MSGKVRVRFAPSPTGALHIGGVRTALYNYLFARKHQGAFILRVEDTDQSRYVAGAEQYILESLEWLNIYPDEGPGIGGEFGPYRQSERKDIYANYARQLLDDGHAYYAFDTPEELDQMRDRLKAARIASPQYNSITRTTMKNSLTLPEDEVSARIESGEPYVIRLKVPRKEEVRLNDMVRGWVMVHSSAIDDKVLVKADGMPTYHLANVVDDHLMEISHVIRGEEWLPSAPLHVLLYKFLGWADSMPQFAHLPLLLKPDGVGKLSKRDADKNGFPIFPLSWKDPETGELSEGFKERGYLPDAFLNFLSLLGWNPGSNQEIFSMSELTNQFSIDRIGKAGVKFDILKAQWFNQQYIKNQPDEELAEHLLQQCKEANIPCTPEQAAAVCRMLKERVVFLSDFLPEGRFLFQQPDSYDNSILSKRWDEPMEQAILLLKTQLESVDPFSAEHIKPAISDTANQAGVKMGAIMQTLRVILTGGGSGPDLMDIFTFLGKEEINHRLALALNKLEGYYEKAEKEQ